MDLFTLAVGTFLLMSYSNIKIFLLVVFFQFLVSQGHHALVQLSSIQVSTSSLSLSFLGKVQLIAPFSLLAMAWISLHFDYRCLSSHLFPSIQSCYKFIFLSSLFPTTPSLIVFDLHCLSCQQAFTFSYPAAHLQYVLPSTFTLPPSLLHMFFPSISLQGGRVCAPITPFVSFALQDH